MSFFRSAAVRRIIYAIAIGLALVRFANRAHSEPLSDDAFRPVPPAIAYVKE